MSYKYASPGPMREHAASLSNARMPPMSSNWATYGTSASQSYHSLGAAVSPGQTRMVLTPDSGVFATPPPSPPAHGVYTARHGHTLSNESLAFSHAHSLSLASEPEGSINPYFLPPLTEAAHYPSTGKHSGSKSSLGSTPSPDADAGPGAPAPARKQHRRNPPAYSPVPSPEENMFGSRMHVHRVHPSITSIEAQMGTGTGAGAGTAVGSGGSQALDGSTVVQGSRGTTTSGTLVQEGGGSSAASSGGGRSPSVAARPRLQRSEETNERRQARVGAWAGASQRKT